MSNFFAQELRKLFEDGQIIQSPVFLGNACYGILDSDLRVRAELVTSGNPERYDALSLAVLNRTHGVVDRLTMQFVDIMGVKVNPDDPQDEDGYAPNIIYYMGEAEWFSYKPNAEDYRALQAAAGQYLDIFRKQAQNPD